MTDTPEPLLVEEASIEAAPIQIPGATPGEIEAQLLNIDLARGIVATIIHFKPGAEIPAHFHKEGSEAHYVLEGELIDAGRRLGPGAYLTHAAGVVHGPHRSETGCRVLTVQGGKMAYGDEDFHLVEDQPREGEERPAGSPNARTEWSPDQAADALAATDLPETQTVAPTPDNPTNPTTG